MNQDGLRRQMDLLAQDACEPTIGQQISGVTHTNTITTVYKDGSLPITGRISLRISNP